MIPELSACLHVASMHYLFWLWCYGSMLWCPDLCVTWCLHYGFLVMIAWPWYLLMVLFGNRSAAWYAALLGIQFDVLWTGSTLVIMQQGPLQVWCVVGLFLFWLGSDCKFGLYYGLCWFSLRCVWKHVHGILFGNML